MPKDWPTRDLVCTTLQAFGYGLVGAVSLQNTPVASDMILDTTQEYSKAIGYYCMILNAN